MNRTKSGLRIPDQNLWTGERLDVPLFFAWDPNIANIRLSYLDPDDSDWELGALWVRHSQDRTGLYKWKAINTPRTRLMMREHLCMVCTESCVRDDGRTWWLFVNDPDTDPDGTPITNLPPTCPGCIPESLKTCPRLVERSRIVTVADTEPYAITADLYMPSTLDEMPVKAVHEVNLRLDSDDAPELLPLALAKQPWLRLLDMRDEPFALT